ncbi:MAG: AAA family ATPase [Bacteroidaceae bacterium]|nr:AAA family ATPase [Bacteroidaceae bacterium]
METQSMEELYRTSNRMVARTPTEFHRYLYDKIAWDARMVAIKGARGVGKTTMMLQRIKETFADSPEKALYVSMDNLWFKAHSLSDVVEYHYTHGGTHIFIDEIHKYGHWQTLVKNIADEYPDLHVVYTGSSMLRIDSGEGDLSRRQLVYVLRGLSFREYLSFEGILQMPAFSLPELLQHHQHYAMQITGSLRILAHFETYLDHGYYPFYKRDAEGFDQRLQAVARAVLYEDLPSVEDVTYETVRKVQQMLVILAEHVPQTPNMNELYAQLETNRNQGLKMLYLLERAAMLSLLSSEKKSMKQLAKPDKILMDNPNLMYALSVKAQTGTVREVFFHNQLSAVAEVNYPRKGDFLVDHRYLFEVGGRKKSFEQIKDVPDSFLAVDGVETGHGNRIPLWLFGFLY